MICDSNTFVSYSQFLEQVKWVFSRLQSYLPLAGGVYTLTAMIVFYNYVIDTNIVFHTLGINSHYGNVRTHADLFTLENHNFLRAEPSGYTFRRVNKFSCLSCNQAICSLITGIGWTWVVLGHRLLLVDMKGVRSVVSVPGTSWRFPHFGSSRNHLQT